MNVCILLLVCHLSLVCKSMFYSDCLSCSISDFSQDFIDCKLSGSFLGVVLHWRWSMSHNLKEQISLPSRVLLWGVVRFHTAANSILLCCSSISFCTFLLNLFWCSSFWDSVSKHKIPSMGEVLNIFRNYTFCFRWYLLGIRKCSSHAHISLL